MHEQLSFFNEREQLLFRLQNYKVNKISHSKLAAYQQCPFYYYLLYVRRVVVPKPVHFAFGEGIHHKLDEFYEKIFSSAQAFANTWSRYWTGIVAGDFLPEEAKAHLEVSEYERVNKRSGKVHTIRIGNHIRFYGSDPVNQFYGRLSQGKRLLGDFGNENIDKAPPILREKKHDFILKAKSGKEYLMTSVLDRIDKVERRLILSDYKTDRVLPFQIELVNKPQFAIYHRCCEDLLGRPPDEIYYNHLVTSKVYPIIIEQRHFDNLEAMLEQFTTGIKNLDFDPKSSRVCGLCDYSFNGVCKSYLEEYMELKEELKKGKIIIPQGLQWSSLLTDKPAEATPAKRKSSGKRRFKGETDTQHALFSRKPSLK